MKYVGAHVSIAGGVENAPLNAAAIGAKAFAMFTKNQRQWASAPLSAESIAAFRRNCLDNGFTPDRILPHDGYLINLGNPDPVKRETSRKSFLGEMTRCMQLGLIYLNFHPGSHVGQGVETGVEQIAHALRNAMAPGYPVTVLLETMAGKGSEVGGRFEELKMILDAVGRDDLGVCLDTCHVWDAGYDVENDGCYLSPSVGISKPLKKNYTLTVAFTYGTNVYCR